MPSWMMSLGSRWGSVGVGRSECVLFVRLLGSLLERRGQGVVGRE